MTNTESLKVPDWVNQQLFYGLIKQHFSNFLAIQKFVIKPAVGCGENFGAVVLRIQIEMEMKDGTKEEVNYILKIPPVFDCNNDDEYHDVFVFELDMYDRLIPELENIYAENTSLLVKFKPLHYKFTDKEKLPRYDYLLMEDLRAKAYRNVNRTLGLDQRQMEAVLKKLAQWHAASAARASKFRDYEEGYRESYFSTKYTNFINDRNMVHGVPFLECMQQTYDLNSEHQILISNYMDRLTDLYIEFGRINPAEFNVLNHGDFWCNNFMFKFEGDSDKIADVCFVDFQSPKYGTPAQDLFCLLMTSPQLSLKLSKFDHFVEFYHQELVKHFELLNCNRSAPSLKELQQNLWQNSLWAFICAQRVLPVVLLPPDEAQKNEAEEKLDEKEGEMAYWRETYLSPGYVEQIKQILPWLIERSYIR